MKPRSIDPKDVRCPKCKAAVGERCYKLNRWGSRTANESRLGEASFHQARRDAAIEEPVAHANPKHDQEHYD